jgi:hypothetical protein
MFLSEVGIMFHALRRDGIDAEIRPMASSTLLACCVRHVVSFELTGLYGLDPRLACRVQIPVTAVSAASNRMGKLSVTIPRTTSAVVTTVNTVTPRVGGVSAHPIDR